LAGRATRRGVRVYPHAAASVDAVAGDAERCAYADEGVFEPADVGHDVDRVGELRDRVAGELARPVPGDPAAAVDVEHLGNAGAGHRALPRLRPLARGVDRL